MFLTWLMSTQPSQAPGATNHRLNSPSGQNAHGERDTRLEVSFVINPFSALLNAVQSLLASCQVPFVKPAMHGIAIEAFVFEWY